MLKSLYLHNRFFYAIIFLVLLLVASYSLEWLFPIAKVLVIVLAGLVILDIFLLYAKKNAFKASRKTFERLSNGDKNPIHLEVKNLYNFPVQVKIIDELPEQFQERNFHIFENLASQESKSITYFLRPTKRGEYDFGALNVFVASPIRMIMRRFQFSQNVKVPTYPAFFALKKYEILAFSNHLTEMGIKKIRRFGNNREFEQIKEYVQGDDIRTINWKATARRNTLMTNHYQDERSQNVYNIIDKGRTMKMPFEGLSLLDYAINASLVMSKVTLNKDDKAGLITFGHKIDVVLPATREPMQMNKIIENLYKQKTAYKEANFERLYLTIKHKIKQRSLLLLYTNFESLSSMMRQIGFLRKISASHLLVVIIFYNTELDKMIFQEPTTTEEIYNQTIAEKLAFEKKLIIKELRKYGIQAILTKPQDLTVNAINKYLEIKAKGLL
ncbi:DUF58 domain-containing protein [Raineya orbicola]|uniref:DUF58 domain-containing protein n=1 Tax=Raineya orbicola TaxID=2016530 RepID=A0A2N3IF78_9BACT|nr:DUF58 domain-containing protein [Raineya orbicola]PKQ68945.1 hypothetical protein Rain11_1478 [Raineya orbicola]